MKEIFATTTISGNLDKNVRHLSISFYPEYRKFPMIKTRVRSFLALCKYSELGNVDILEILKENCRHLRALQLSGFRAVFVKLHR